MPAKTIQMNRAPVLTLWATVVAQHLGFDEDEACTLGKAVAGLNAQAKARSLGIVKPSETKGKPARKVGLGEDFWVEICGRPVPAKKTDDGVRAVIKDKAIDPASVKRYFKSKFGDDLDAVRNAMEDLASSFAKNELEEQSYGLYEEFRPDIPKGKKGWGAKGKLDLGKIRSLAKSS